MTTRSGITARDEDRGQLRFFQLECLSEGLTSGRFCGVSIDDELAQFILVLLERLVWTPDTHEFVTALPHFPVHFGLAEIRSNLANLGYPSSMSMVPGSRLKFCGAGTVVCDRRGVLWLVGEEAGKTVLFKPGETAETLKIRPEAVYRTIQFHASFETKRKQVARANIG